MSDDASRGGSWTFTVECRTREPARRGRRHPVVVHPDGSVDTPHDLAAERVAVALGGYLSCVELVDRVLPAFHRSLPVLNRRTPAALGREGFGRWRVADRAERADCCAGRSFASAGQAARHLRTATHLARRHDVALWQLSAVLRAAEKAWGPWEGSPPERPGVAGLVREAGGLAELWRAGIHPDDLPALAAPAAVVGEPLPVSFFVGLRYGGADPDWVADILRRRPDGDTAAWLVNLNDHDRSAASAAEWSAWLSQGLARDDAALAIQAGVPSTSIGIVAERTGWSRAAAARALVTWAWVGCRPSPEHFAVIGRRGLDRERPSRGAIDAAWADAAQRRASGRMLRDGPPDRTELAVMLLIAGSRPALAAALDRGIRTVAGLDSPSPERTP